MEDVTEDAAVDGGVVVVVIGLRKLAHVQIVELQGAAHIPVDGCGREQDGQLCTVLYGLWPSWLLLLPSLQGEGGSGRRESGQAWRAFHHELQQEPADFTRLAVVGGTVVDDGDVRSALQQTMKIVAVDGHFVVGGGELVSLTQTAWDERRVAVVGSPWKGMVVVWKS